MQAIILAAGRATRLQPITNDIPKCLIPLNNTTILDRQLEALKKNGIREVVIVVGFEEKKVRDYVKKSTGLRILFVENKVYRTTGPAYSLWCSRNFLNEPILYLNGDVLFHPDILTRILLSRHQNVTAIQYVPWDEEEVNIVANEEGRVLELGKHISETRSGGEFIGITKLGKQFNKKLKKALEKFVSEGHVRKFAADALNLAINRYGGRLYAEDVTDLPAIEVDTEEDLKRAHEMFSSLKV